jgi:hypothetical protein
MRSFKNDYAFGLEQESELLPKLNTYFKEEFKKTASQYAPFDFTNDKKLFLELKSRTITFKRYTTTICPVHKLKKLKADEKLILVFNFTDGVYYCNYDPELWSTYKISLRKPNNRTDIKDLPTPHYEIPITDLIEIKF